MSSTRSRWLTAIVLILILFVAFTLRTYNVDWADGQLPHPDERSTIAFYAPTIKWPSDTSTLLDPRKSTLNPLWDVGAERRRSYTYGHFPLYLMVAAGHLTPKLVPVAEAIGAPEEYVHMMRIANGSPGFGWVGRIIMALADSITVFYLFLIGRRLYSKEAGLLAAALGAFTVIQIQLAHFFAVDPISTTFTVAAVYHAIRMVDTRGWTQTILTGVMASLAIASKFSAAPILAAPAVAGLIITWRQQHEEEEGASKSEVPGLIAWCRCSGGGRSCFCHYLALCHPRFREFQPSCYQRTRCNGAGRGRFPIYSPISGHDPVFILHRGTSQVGDGLALRHPGLAGLWLGDCQSIVAESHGRRIDRSFLAGSLLLDYRWFPGEIQSLHGAGSALPLAISCGDAVVFCWLVGEETTTVQKSTRLKMFLMLGAKNQRSGIRCRRSEMTIQTR